MALDFAIGIAGSGGDGVLLLGEMMAKAASKVGLNAVQTKSFGPQIRGGESSSRIRVSDRPLTWAGDKVDALMIFHWADLVRFKAELTVKQHATIVVDAADDTPEDEIPLPKTFKPRILRIPFEEIAQEATGAKLGKNMVMAGVAVELFNWPIEGLREYAEQRWEKRGAAVIEANMKAIEAGREYCRQNFTEKITNRIEYERKDPLVFMSGNDAFAYGSLCAGCRFMAGYPITPSSEVLEFMSRELPRFDGVCVQAEDEISAMCMTIGASFGGIKSMTTTSGPGLALKQEAIGLATIAELPVVIMDTQRGGPSTGLPTRTEQSDLNIAIYGGHGDCPRVVLAATSVLECYELAHVAFEIAEKYQTPVIVLLDQYLGHSYMTLEGINVRHDDPKDQPSWFIANYRPETWDDSLGNIEDFKGKAPSGKWRKMPSIEEIKAGYKRFRLTDNGVSPISAPGIPGGEYMAVGIEHDVTGYPASSQVIHQSMSEKRYRKFEKLAEDGAFKLFHKACDVDEAPQLGILTWGSAFGVCSEICELLNQAGLRTQVLAPQILYPLPYKEIQEWLNGIDQLITVETSFSDQFYHYIRAFLELPENSYHYSRAGGIPMYLGEVLKFILYNIELPEGFDRPLVEQRLNW